MTTPPPTASVEILEVRTRLDDQTRALEIEHLLVQEGLAACAHVSGPLTSVYRWNGVVETTQEYELDAITVQGRLHEVVSRIQALHPYELPAILVTPVQASVAYAQWVAQTTTACDVTG